MKLHDSVLLPSLNYESIKKSTETGSYLGNALAKTKAKSFGTGARSRSMVVTEPMVMEATSRAREKARADRKVL